MLVTQEGSTFLATQGSSLLASGHTVHVLAGSITAADKALFYAGQNVELAAGREIRQETSHSERKRGVMSGTSVQHEESYSSNPLPTTTKAGSEAIIKAGKSILLTATKVKAPKLTLVSPEVLLRADVRQYSCHRINQSSDFHENRVEESGGESVNYVYADFPEDIEIRAQQVEMDVPSTGLLSWQEKFKQDVETHRQHLLGSGQELTEEEAHELSLLPKIIQKVCTDRDEYYHKVTRTTGAGLMMVVSMAVNIATGGVMTPLASTITSQFVVNLVNSGGRLDKAFKMTVSSDGVKSIAKAAAMDFMMGGGPSSNSTFTQRLAQNALRASVSSTIDMALYGKSFKDAAKDAVLSTTANTLGQEVSKKIGAEYAKDDSNLNYLTHKIAHALTGGATGVLRGAINGDAEGGFIAGATGAVIGEIIGDAQTKAIQGRVKDRVEALQAQGVKVTPETRYAIALNEGRTAIQAAKLTSALVALATGKDPSIAADAAGTAMENNSLGDNYVKSWKFISESEKLADLKDKQDQAQTDEEKESFQEAISKQEKSVKISRDSVFQDPREVNQASFAVLAKGVQKAEKSIDDLAKEYPVGARVLRYGMYTAAAVGTAYGCTQSPGSCVAAVGSYALMNSSAGDLVISESQRALAGGMEFMGAQPDDAKILAPYALMGLTQARPKASGGAKGTPKPKATPAASNVSVVRPVLPDPPKGYHYKKLGDGKVVVARNPGSYGKPPLKLENGKFVPVPTPRSALQITKPVHKNSNQYVGQTHLYVIKDETGKILKYGETATGFNKQGQLKRAQEQIRKLEDLHPGKRFDSEVVRQYGSKFDARKGPRGEEQYIKTFRKIFGQESLPLNKGNR